MNIKEFPLLYHKGKSGELRIWQIHTEDNVIVTNYGILDGTAQQAEKKVYGKNLGKKNETSDTQQAQLEAEAMWINKKDRKYSTTIENACIPLVLPMLAKEFNPSKADYPGLVQPKYDGCRSLAYWEDSKIMLLSRGGKEWTVPHHIAEQVAEILPKDFMLDGELYVHGKSCQTITSYIKKLRPETEQVEYHVYDMPIIDGRDDFNNYDRWLGLHELLSASTVPSIKEVPTIVVQDYETAKLWEEEFVGAGYEGAIFRNAAAMYTFGYRSADLMKIKTFKDAEFVVLSCREGSGKFEGCAIFTCQNDITDGIFECTVATSMEARAEMFQNQEKYIGQKLTVKFFERTDDKLPRFPVGKLFRDLKDIE